MYSFSTGKEYLGIILSGLLVAILVYIKDSNIGTVAAIYALQLLLLAVFNSIYIYFGSRNVQSNDYLQDKKSNQLESWVFIVLFFVVYAPFAILIFYDDGAGIFIQSRAPQIGTVMVAVGIFLINYVVKFFSYRQLNSHQDESFDTRIRNLILFLFLQLIPLIILFGFEDFIALGTHRVPLLIFILCKTVMDVFLLRLRVTHF